ncbi:MAG: imelysin family protein [Planctomycetota bacterium]
MIKTLAALPFAAVVAALVLPAQSDGAALRAVVQRHADHCHRIPRELAARAGALRSAVANLVASPDPAALHGARAAWTSARGVYGQIEALRFHGGPIDGVEPLLNAWPVDEVYIDYVTGQPAAGIVADRAKVPVLAASVLAELNARGGETNVSVGWHAIEFLLWGQDLDPAGPGRRPWTDFADGPAGSPHAARRRQYLAVVTEQLAANLADLARQWAPDADNFRRRYERDPADAVRRMLTGAITLTSFELAGERLAVAYETRDQEQEHSCFSDTTCDDLVANQLGIDAIFRGGLGEPTSHDLLGLVRSKDPAVAELPAARLDATRAALRAIPAPFDQAFLGQDDGPGRTAIRRAITALEEQAEAIAIAGGVLGHDLPLRRGN